MGQKGLSRSQKGMSERVETAINDKFDVQPCLLWFPFWGRSEFLCFETHCSSAGAQRELSKSVARAQ